MQIVITDCEYRSAVALCRSLARAGHTLYLVQNAEMQGRAPVFSSRYAHHTEYIDAKANDAAYLDKLEALCRQIGCPVLLPVGAKTIAVLVRNRERVDGFCKVLLPSEEVLDHTNDKAYVQALARKLQMPTPMEYADSPDRYPVIVKPRCGEKLGLVAAERYRRADNEAEFNAVMEQMKQYDEHPVVEEYVKGEGVGVCLVMHADGAAAAICHRRIREYPISGGPSTCCETFYDEELISRSEKLLAALGYVGIAMVEYKGVPGDYKLLEINPRVWGSFPLTEAADSHFALRWAEAADGTRNGRTDTEFARPKRMRFALNDTLCVLSLLKARKWRAAGRGMADALNPTVREALFRWRDPAPFFVYLKNALRKSL